MSTLTRSILAVAVVFGVSAFGHRPAQAQTVASLPAATPPAKAAGQTRPVQAWIRFCERSPEECAVDSSQPETITLTRQSWQTLVSINAKVNATVKPLTDEDHWGVADLWSLPTDGYGDCEDYQLLKRKLLVETGLPRRALRMTVVVDDATGQGHAVLTVRTSGDDLILDNQTDEVLNWQESGYTFVKRESSQSVGWVFLEAEASTAVVAMA